MNNLRFRRPIRGRFRPTLLSSTILLLSTTNNNIVANAQMMAMGSYHLGCGATSGNCENPTQIAHVAELHELRCCADSDLDGSGGTIWKRKFGNTCPAGVWGASMMDSTGECIHAVNFNDGKAICEDAGGRLCTKEELEADCTRWTGCDHDSDMIWSSTSDTPMHHNVFHELSCNAALTVDDCAPTSSNYEGTLSSLIDSGSGYPEVVIPCGKCIVADTMDGSTLAFPNGIDVQGMLYFPPTANVIVETTHIFVQGILKMDPPSTALGNEVRVRMVGSVGDEYLFPHPENAMACDAATGCKVGKKAIAVAGGRLDIRGLEDETCPAHTKLQSIVPPSGVAESGTGCALDYDMAQGDGTFDSYDLGPISDQDLVGFSRHHGGQFEVREEEDGNKYLHQSAASRYIAASGPGIKLLTECMDPPSQSNNKGRYRFSMRYRSHGEGTDSWNPVLQLWPGGRNGPQCPAAIDDEWVTCNAVVTLVDGDESLESMDLVVSMHTDPNKSIDYDDVSFESLSVSHEITVADPKAAECWSARPDDEILITYSGVNAWENQAVKTVKSVDAVTGTISFAQTDSVGNPNDPASLDSLSEETQVMAAEVAWLSRPIVFEAEGDGPSGSVHDALHGGHLIVYHTPSIAQHIEGVEIRNFGQQGELGRYPIHFHMSGSVAGSIVRKNVIRDSKQRCVVIHGSHDVMVEDTVAFDTYGHCFILEDGGEHGNTFKNNLGARTRNQELTIGSTDHIASTLWITNPENHFVGNIAAGSQHNGIWFELRDIRGGSAKLPENAGVDPKHLTLGTFKDNTAHSCKFRAITTYDIGYRPFQEALFEGMSSYHNDIGFMIHGTNNVRVKDSFFGFNNLGVLNFGNFESGNIMEDSTVISSCDKTGISFAQEPVTKQLQVQTTKFINHCASGHSWPLRMTLGQCSNCDYDTPVLKNLSFESSSENAVYAVQIEDLPGKNVFVEDPNGSMNPDGLPGFFVNNVAQMTAFIDGSLCSPVPSSLGLFCKNTCLRRMFITDDTSEGNQMVVTSKIDSTKTFVFDKVLGGNTFDVALPFDEYSVHFLSTTGDVIDPLVNLEFADEANGTDLPSCEHITAESIDFGVVFLQ